MTSEFYQLALTDRRRMLADAGFVRNDLRVWSHPDGKSIGEGVAVALTDQAFMRFLRLELPMEITPETGEPEVRLETGAL